MVHFLTFLGPGLHLSRSTSEATRRQKNAGVVHPFLSEILAGLGNPRENQS